jgi:hypothetical protein
MTFKGYNIYEYLIDTDENHIITLPSNKTAFLNKTGFHINYIKKKLAVYETTTGILTLTCDFRNLRLYESNNEIQDINNPLPNVTDEEMDALSLTVFTDEDSFKKPLKEKTAVKDEIHPYSVNFTQQATDLMNSYILENKRLKDVAIEKTILSEEVSLLNETINLESCFHKNSWFGFRKNKSLSCIFYGLSVDRERALQHSDLDTIKDIETYTYYKDLLFTICENTGSRQIIKFLKNSKEMENKTNLVPICKDKRLSVTIKDINRGYMTIEKLKKQLLQFANCLNNKNLKTALLVKLLGYVK